MKTSKEWVDEVAVDNDKFVKWLKRQFIGETLAAKRIEELSIAEGLTDEQRMHLMQISADEYLHAVWISRLLSLFGIPEPTNDEVNYEQDRYWNEVKIETLSLDELFAAGAHAETMRLDRIRAIVECSEMHPEVRKTFAAIQPMEEYHAATFRKFTTDEAFNKTFENHERGMMALNLIM